MRLHKTLLRYARGVERAVRELNDCHVERFEEEVVSFLRLNLHIRVRFAKGHLLEINEAIFIERGKLVHLGYRYHFQDKENKLIFRYDDTPHFRSIDTFPHHKHLESNAIPSTKPKVQRVIEEAKKISNEAA